MLVITLVAEDDLYALKPVDGIHPFDPVRRDKRLGRHGVRARPPVFVRKRIEPVVKRFDEDFVFKPHFREATYS
jgi:hypothetical protein